MIDLRRSDADLREHVAQHYGHLAPPSDHKPRQSGTSQEDWLTTPDYGLDEDQARDRARGALLGLAIGDAIGTTIEFSARDTARVSDMVGGGPFGLQPGEWTDDTSMALCLADSLIEEGGFVAEAFTRQLIRWYRHGHNSMNGRCFDIGHATRAALEGHEAQGMRWQGNTDTSTAGNGSVIRLAPLVIAYRSSLRSIWERSVGTSIVTHGAAEAIDGCRLLGIHLCHALHGASREQALSPKLAPLPPRLQIINAGEYKHKQRAEIRSSGYVVDTLEAALWAIWNSGSFEEAVLLAANLGDDADSVAAVAGQLAGALYGLEGIPSRWVDRLAWSAAIRDRADALFDLSRQALT